MRWFLASLLVLSSLTSCLLAIIGKNHFFISAFFTGIASSVLVAPWNRSTLRGFSIPGARIERQESGAGIEIESRKTLISFLWFSYNIPYWLDKIINFFKTVLVAGISFATIGLIIGIPSALLGKAHLIDVVIAAMGVGGSLLAHEFAHFIFLSRFCNLSFHYAAFKVGFFQFVYGFFFVIRDNRSTPLWNALSALAGPTVNLGIALCCLGLRGPYFAIFGFNAAFCCLELLPVGLVFPEVIPSDGEVAAYYLWDIWPKRKQSTSLYSNRSIFGKEDNCST